MKVKAIQSCPTLCDSHGLTLHGILQARILEWVVLHFSSRSSRPSDQTQVSQLQAHSLPAEPQMKPRNMGVGSQFLLQWIFLTQNQTGVSYFAGGLFTNWTIRDTVHVYLYSISKIPQNWLFLCISRQWILLYCFYRWGCWNSKKVSNMSKKKKFFRWWREDLNIEFFSNELAFNC